MFAEEGQAAAVVRSRRGSHLQRPPVAVFTITALGNRIDYHSHRLPKGAGVAFGRVSPIVYKTFVALDYFPAQNSTPLAFGEWTVLR
jgi:hypothetical protein